jgi:DNA invertase Pin-like site-specific DNA recombinase
MDHAAAAERMLPMLIGYARVSKKKGQRLAPQLLALERAGCKVIFKEQRRGRSPRHPQLDAALAALKRGDTLVVWHIDRLGRTARELLNLNYELKQRGVNLRSLVPPMETETDEGEYNFNITCANAQLESARISRRTKAGLDVARKRGKKLGRRKEMTEAKTRRARELLKDGRLGPGVVAARLGVGRTTLWREVGAVSRKRALANAVC